PSLPPAETPSPANRLAKPLEPGALGARERNYFAPAWMRSLRTPESPVMDHTVKPFLSLAWTSATWASSSRADAPGAGFAPWVLDFVFSCLSCARLRFLRKQVS